jgi:hypothetical protein
MKIELDTGKVCESVAEQIVKLPADKRKHFFFSYCLGVMSEPFRFPESYNETFTSIDILKSIIDIFQVGLKKEYEDAGKDFSSVENRLNEMVTSLCSISDLYETDGIKGIEHETDLLADLAGASLWVLASSMRGLNFHYWED